MERALDPNLLEKAIDNHASLPTPEELATQLAQAEMALLLQKPELPDELLTTAWYLHGVASSPGARERYGRDRIRAAFQVSNHILDISLQSRDLSEISRFSECFAAQIACLGGGLDPNSIALYRNVVEKTSITTSSLTLEDNEGLIALLIGTAMMGFDTPRSACILADLQNMTTSVAESWGLEQIEESPFACTGRLIDGADALLSFMTGGDSNALDRCIRHFDDALNFRCNNQTVRWVASHLSRFAEIISKSSVWTALPDSVPDSVRQTFTLSEPRVLSLWPPQIEFLDGDNEDAPDPFASECKRLFLSTPTSGGKTLLAQLLVVNHVVTVRTGVCFVAPTRSLCAEIKDKLGSRLRYLGKEVAAGLPDNDILSMLDIRTEVEVMTPERLSFLLRTQASDTLLRFGMFVFDEVHNISDGGRGWTVEEDLTYLHNATKDTDHRILLMSAAIGNRAHFIEWMAQDGSIVHHSHTEWRGPRRISAIWTTDVKWGQERLEPSRSTDYPLRKVYPVHGKLRARLSHDGIVHSLVTTESVGEIKFRARDEGHRERSPTKCTPFYQMLVSIIVHLGQAGPVLIVEATKSQSIRMAKAIAKELEEPGSESLSPVLDLIEARLGTEHPLYTVISSGVAYHHGSLPREIRTAIEHAVSAGQLNYLVATTTMTEGVNIPVRSVVIASQGTYGAEGFNEYITGPKLVNAIGRAGRAAKETEGIVVLARNAGYSQDDFERLNPSDEDMQATSSLASEDALNELATVEEMIRNAEDAFYETTTGIVAEFMSFVWFTASQAELLNPATDWWPEIEGMLNHLLAWRQLDDDDKQRWTAIAQFAFDHYNEKDANVRRRWAKTRLCPQSSGTLDTLSISLGDLIIASGVPDSPSELIELIVESEMLDTILSLPESPKRKAFNRRSGGRGEIALNMGSFLIDWITGNELQDLADTYFSVVDDLDFRFEQLGDFINDYFEVFLPWVLGTLIEWTNSYIDAEENEERIPSSLPAFVRYGIDRRSALTLMAKGISSRALALRIAQAWDDAGQPEDIHTWVGGMSIQEWRDSFQANTTEIRNLLQYVRDAENGLPARFLGREVVELNVESQVEDMPPTGAELRPVENLELAPMGIWVADNVVGRILTREHADIRDLLQAGIPIKSEFSALDGAGKLVLDFTR